MGPDEVEGEGTTEGFEMSVQEFTTLEPAKALEVWEVAKELPAGFTQSLLDGLRDRLIKREAINWTGVLPFVRHAVGLATDSTKFPVSTRVALLRSVVALIDEGVQSDLIRLESEDEVWEILTEITKHLFTSEDDSSEELISLDALVTTGLNHPTSRVVRADLHAGLWSYRFRETQDRDDARRAVQRHLVPLLDEVMKSDGLKRITSLFNVGQLLPQLQLVAPEWLRPRLDELLDNGAEDPLAHPAWCSYLLHSPFYDSTFELLRPRYVRSAQVLRPDAGGSMSDTDRLSWTRKLAEHLMSALLRGVAAVGDEDALVETAFTNLAVTDRQHAYWAVFRAWSDAKNAPPNPFVERLIAFWEWRLNQLEVDGGTLDAGKEAQGLGWFLLTPYLPENEVIRLGVRTARLAKGDLEVQIDWDRLAKLAAQDSDSVYEIVELVLSFQVSTPQHFIPAKDVRPVLAEILKTGHASTRDRARRLVNRLGEAGYDEFKDLVLGKD